MTDSGTVARVIDKGRAAWPDLSPDREQLGALIEDCVARFDAADEVNEIDEAEVYLACACATGDSAAIEVFEGRYFPAVIGALARMALERDRIDDVIQALRIRLFVADEGDHARVIKYAGRGQLQGLVRVAATRIALNLLRRNKRSIADDDWLSAVPELSANPELANLKAEQRAEFKQIFEDAVRALDSRERTVLRLSLVDRLTIDTIGGIYRVHRATAARWIARARERLSALTRKKAGQRLGLRAGELDSVLDLVESQIELSIERLFRSTA